MKKLLLIASLLLSATAFAQDEIEEPQEITPGFSIDVILQNPSSRAETVTKALEASGYTTSAGYEIYTIDVDIETFPGEGDSKYFLNLNYTSEEGTVSTTKLGTSTNGTAINRGNAETPIQITVSAWYNTKDKKVEYIDSYFNLLLFDVTSDWTARGYWPSNTDSKDLSAYFIYDENDNKGSGTAFLRRAINANASTANYYCGSQNETRFKIPSLKGYPSGLYNATLNYKELTVEYSDVKSIDIYINKYSTFYAPTEVVLPQTLKAYTLVYENNVLKGTEISNLIPANTPVMLEVVNEENENSIFVLTVTDNTNCEYTAIDGTKRYIADYKKEWTDNEEALEDGAIYPAFVGVNQTHYVSADVDVYVLNGLTGQFELKSSKVNGTNLIANTANIMPIFTAYIELPSEKWNDNEDLSVLEVVFNVEEEEPQPAEKVEKYYLHYTDKDGNYISTFQGSSERFSYFWDNDNDGTYLLEYIKFDSDTYFVISASSRYGIVEQPSGDEINDVERGTTYMSPRKVTEAASWEGFEGTVYGLGENNKVAEFDPTTDNVKPFEGKQNVTQAKKLLFTPPTEENDGLLVEDNSDIPTGIDAVTVSKGIDGAIYNVFGQSVDENYKGIVIKNGKKFIQR